MPGRNPHEAYKSFLGPIQFAVSCVAQAKVMVSRGGQKETDRRHSLTINNGDEVDLGRGLRLWASIDYTFLPIEGGGFRWKVRTLAYRYNIYDGEKELLSFHWHPDGRSPLTTPHVHLGAPTLSKTGLITPHTHLPTGRVSFESVVRLLITELGVKPRVPNWRERLDSYERLFRDHMTWG